MVEVVIIGAGTGGLTTALALHARGVVARVYEAAPEIKPLGVGINLLPHATRVLDGLGLTPALRAVAIETQESAFFDRFGALIFREPAGLFAGWPYPQFSIHRGDLQMALLAATRERLGPDAVVTGRRCVEVGDAGGVAFARLFSPDGVEEVVRGDVVIAADGVHSVARRQFYPDEGEMIYSGINMWRGVTRAPPFLTGASMVRCGALRWGKMVIYPIRDNIDGQGSQLINWVAEIYSETHLKNDWNRPGRVEDFLPNFEGYKFDWLDIPNLIRSADQIFEYPMVDRNPLPRWTQGRVTLLGDAAHPMYPRGSNGAAQAILDAERLAETLTELRDPVAALDAYEADRRPKTSKVVETNRRTPPDYVIEAVDALTGGAPFARIEDVASREMLEEIVANYRKIVGADPAALARETAA